MTERFALLAFRMILTKAWFWRWANRSQSQAIFLTPDQGFRSLWLQTEAQGQAYQLLELWHDGNALKSAQPCSPALIPHASNLILLNYWLDALGFMAKELADANYLCRWYPRLLAQLQRPAVWQRLWPLLEWQLIAQAGFWPSTEALVTDQCYQLTNHGVVVKQMGLSARQLSDIAQGEFSQEMPCDLVAWHAFARPLLKQELSSELYQFRLFLETL